MKHELLPVGIASGSATAPCIQNTRKATVRTDADDISHTAWTYLHARSQGRRHLRLILLLCKSTKKKHTHQNMNIYLACFPVCHPSPKSSEMTSGGSSVSIAALAVSVKPWRCQQIFYKVPLLHLRRRRPPLLWDRHGGICVVDHTRTVNLTPQSHWVIAIFCCPGAFHTRKMTGLNYSGCSQLSARIYRPI